MQLNDQLKLVKYKLDNINELHSKLADQGRLSTIEMDLLLRNMMEVYEFYHILKMEKVLWQQADPGVYEHRDDLTEGENDVAATPIAAEEEESVVEEGEESVVEEEVSEIEESAPEEEMTSPEPEPEKISVVERVTMSTMSLFSDAAPEVIVPSQKVTTQPEVEMKEQVVEEEIAATPDQAEAPVTWEIEEEEESITPAAIEQQPVLASAPENTDTAIEEPEPEVLVATARQEPVAPTRSSNKPELPIETHIAINDKFVYIRELFGGDFDTYEQTILEINNLHSRSEALDYLSRNVAERFDWLEKEEIANEFYALLQKHFDF
jgi:hypothetical protein